MARSYNPPKVQAMPTTHTTPILAQAQAIPATHTPAQDQAMPATPIPAPDQAMPDPYNAHPRVGAGHARDFPPLVAIAPGARSSDP